MEKKTCKLIPLEGMEWDGRLIKLGDTKEMVEQVLGAPNEVIRSSCYYHAYDIRFDLAENGTVSFIECIGGLEGNLAPEIFGVPAFATDADELLAMLSERNGPDIDDTEAEYSYALRTLSVGLYREITPADVDAMLMEMSNMKLEALGGVDVEEEMKKAHHWETIGIGVKDYYA